jgi:hypothetical protein
MLRKLEASVKEMAVKMWQWVDWLRAVFSRGFGMLRESGLFVSLLLQDKRLDGAGASLWRIFFKQKEVLEPVNLHPHNLNGTTWNVSYKQGTLHSALNRALALGYLPQQTSLHFHDDPLPILASTEN